LQLRTQVGLKHALKARAAKGVDPKRLLAVWADDIRILTGDEFFLQGRSLWHFLGSGYTLLPLDLNAAKFFNQCGLRYILRGDILTDENAVEFGNDANVLWRAWLEASGSSARFQGIDWLKEDYDSFRWSLTSMSLAARMAKAMIASDVARFAFISNIPQKVGVHSTERNSAAEHVWNALLGSRAEPLEFHDSAAQPTVREFQITLPSYEILVIIHKMDITRLTPFISQLHREPKGRVGVLLLGAEPGEAAGIGRWVRGIDFPVFGLPFFEGIHDDALFDQAFARSVAFFSGQEWGKNIDWLLRYYTRWRWPTLLRWHEAWREAFRRSGVKYGYRRPAYVS